jgi:hypothetical protein
MRERLSKAVFAFGSPRGAFFGHLTLSCDGHIFGYTHPNEHRWTLVGDHLEFRNFQGSTSSSFTHCGDNVWIGHSLTPAAKTPKGRPRASADLFLLPMLDLSSDALPASAFSMSTLIVNSIPKSGTYYVSRVLELLGQPPSGLHMTDDVAHGVFDFRGQDANLMHSAPQDFRIDVWLPLAAKILRGQHAVAHIHEIQTLRSLTSLPDVGVINVVRNLKSVIGSLYAFKLRHVRPLDESDRRWRMLEKGRCAAFMRHFKDSDLLNLGRVAGCILQTAPETRLRYEDLYSLNENAFSAACARFGIDEAVFSRAVKAATNQPTSTLNPDREQYRFEWSSECEAIFHELHLDELNKALGY